MVCDHGLPARFSPVFVNTPALIVLDNREHA